MDKANGFKLTLKDLTHAELLALLKVAKVDHMVKEIHIAHMVMRRKLIQLKQLDAAINKDQARLRRIRNIKKQSEAQGRLNKKVQTYNNAAGIIEQIILKFPEIEKEYIK